MSERGSFNHQEDPETEADRYYTNCNASDYSMTNEKPTEYEIPKPSSKPKLSIPPSKPQVSVLLNEIPLHQHPENGRSPSTKSKLYTALSRPHVPAVYSTPTHENVYAETESMMEVPRPSPQSPSIERKENLVKPGPRVKFVLLSLLVAAISVGVISLVVSVIAVTITSKSSGTTDEVRPSDVERLESEVEELKAAVEGSQGTEEGVQPFNVDISTICGVDTMNSSCTFSLGVNSCTTPSLEMERKVC